MSNQGKHIERICKTLPIMKPKLDGGVSIDDSKALTPLTRICRTLPTKAPKLVEVAESLRLEIVLTNGDGHSSVKSALDLVKGTQSPQQFVAALGELVQSGAIDSIRANVT